MAGTCEFSKQLIYMSLSFCVLAAVGTGCAATHRSSVSETSVTSNNGGTITTTTPAVVTGSTVNGTTVTTTAPVATQHTTTSSTTTTTEHEPEHRGVIGSVFHAIGAVLAFPFIVIGNVIQAIF